MHAPVTEHEDFDLSIADATLRIRRLRLPDGAGRARPPIVFLHDSLGCITAWRDFPERLCLAAGCDGLVYDREGFGASSPLARPRTLRYLHQEAEILRAILERCAVPRALLFGHSDGGSIALLAAALPGSAVPGLVTVGAHVAVEERTLQGLREALPWWESPRFRERLRRRHGDKAEQVFRVWTGTWLSERFRGWTIVPDLAHVACPALIIQGEHDEYATPGHVRTIVEAIAGPAEGWIVPGARHSPHREDDRVLLAAAAFLNRCS